MSRGTFDEIRAFAIQELWEPPDGVTERTSLAHDFGIAGLDGKEFMEKYAVRFGVDLEGFDWVTYFGPEGVGVGAPAGLITYLWRRFVQRIPRRALVELPELNLGHLVECANSGRWRSPRQAV